MYFIEPVLYATTGSLVGLSGAWAALGRGHWFLRWLLVMALITAPLFFGGWELVVTHGIAVLWTVAGVAAYRWRDWRQERFSLASLLLPAAIAPIVAILATMPEGYVRWSSVLCTGGTIALITLLCLWANLPAARWQVRALGVGLAILLVAVFVARLPYFNMLNSDYLLSFYSMMASFVGGADDWYVEPINIWVVLVAVFVAAGLAVAKRDQIGAATVVTVLLVSALPGYVYCQLCTPDPLPPIVLPKANGYDDFLAAGKMIRKLAGTVDFTSNADVAGLTKDEMATLMERLQGAFDRIDRGIAVGSQSPFPYWPVENDETKAETFREHYQVLMLCRLAGEQQCQYFSVSGNVDKLVETALQQIQFSYEADRGASVSGSIAVGRLPVINLLRGSLHRFDRPQRARLIEVLSGVAARQESYELLHARQCLIEQNAGWRVHLAALLREMSSAENESPGLFWVRLTDAEVRTLIVQVALQGYFDDHGHFPPTLKPLVPRYLTEIPENPFGDGAFGYRTDGMKYEITSSANKPVVRYESKGLPPARLPRPPLQSARQDSEGQ